jgi:hypothetical protein
LAVFDAAVPVDELFVSPVGAWLALVAVSAVGSVVEDVVDCSSRGAICPSVEVVDCSFSGSRDIGCSGGGAAKAPTANSSAVGNRARVKAFLFMAYSSSVEIVVVARRWAHERESTSCVRGAERARQLAADSAAAKGAQHGRRYSCESQCTLNPAGMWRA